MRNRLVVIGAALLMLCASCASGSEASSSAASNTGANQTESASTNETDTEADTDAPNSDTPADSDASDSESAEVQQADGPTANEANVSPISQALGFDPDDVLELNNNFIREAEELIRVCMADAGFDYVPVNPGLNRTFARQLELQASLSEQQFVEQYGYGIATLWELSFQGEGVMQFVEQLLGPPPVEVRSPGEQEAYELTLSGTTIQGLTAEEAQAQSFEDPANAPAEDGSCRQIGYDAAENPQGDIFEGFESLLGDELTALNDRFESDQRIRDAQQAWQTCMAEAGYAYEQADEIQGDLFDSAQDLGDRFTSSPEALDLFAQAIDANLSQMDAPTRFEFLERIGALQGFSMVPALQAELDELITFELDVAGRSYECAERDTLRNVRLELEQEFVETHADQLALIVAGES